MSSRGSVGGRERPRLFVALPLPPDAVERLVPWQERELAAGRVVPPRNLHVTLAFLGATPASRLGDVVGELREAGSAAERPVLSVTGYRETRSVGMLVLDDRGGRATALAEDVQARLERIGVYRREPRPWLAHVTVLRFGRPPKLAPPLPDVGEIAPSEAAVYMSVLRRSGAEYEILDSAALGGN